MLRRVERGELVINDRRPLAASRGETAEAEVEPNRDIVLGMDAPSCGNRLRGEKRHRPAYAGIAPSNPTRWLQLVAVVARTPTAHRTGEGDFALEHTTRREERKRQTDEHRCNAPALPKAPSPAERARLVRRGVRRIKSAPAFRADVGGQTAQRIIAAETASIFGKSVRRGHWITVRRPMRQSIGSVTAGVSQAHFAFYGPCSVAVALTVSSRRG